MADHPVTSNEADPSVSAAIPGDAIRTAARLELLAHQRRQRAFPQVEIKDFPWQALLYLTTNSDCHGWVSEQQLLELGWWRDGAALARDLGRRGNGFAQRVGPPEVGSYS